MPWSANFMKIQTQRETGLPTGNRGPWPGARACSKSYIKLTALCSIFAVQQHCFYSNGVQLEGFLFIGRGAFPAARRLHRLCAHVLKGCSPASLPVLQGPGAARQPLNPGRASGRSRAARTWPLLMHAWQNQLPGYGVSSPCASWSPLRISRELSPPPLCPALTLTTSVSTH
ncbi:hypothetical protein SKAU_G00212920 [Synaphobranchus kaupii]|uniref:Uncharacterized protein n=1 Tax=Synaphobranchus kaupii TaxID=118154 RepID=A0A9Q1F9C6_SYNKA|nr:hypothetical protein SKAU_G00212920 [Synaphobranchus kaupii]